MAFNHLITILILTLFSVTRTSNGQSCELGCQREIDNLLEYVSNTNQQLITANDNIDSLFKRVSELENYFYNQLEPMIARLANLEVQLAQNVSNLRTLIYDESASVFSSLTGSINNVNNDLTNRLNGLTAAVNNLEANIGNTGGPAPGAILELYANITRRIDGLEYGKVLNLTTDNLIWRRNFRAVNTTFEKMKKNHCLCQ